jgi:D-proline reductase (dithiol) PrdB
VSLVARVLEENGISTIVIGSAKDIVEYCGVPRYLFTDFPLGNPCGRPYDNTSQRLIMSQALAMLSTCDVPGTTIDTALVWDDSASWKPNFARVDDDNRAELLAAGDARRAAQADIRVKII